MSDSAAVFLVRLRANSLALVIVTRYRTHSSVYCIDAAALKRSIGPKQHRLQLPSPLLAIASAA